MANKQLNAEFDKFEEKMKAFAMKEFGVDMDIRVSSYSDSGFSFSGKCFNGEDGRKEEFFRVALNKGFPANWYNKVFTKDGKKYRIVAGLPRGRKYTISIENVDTGAKSKCAPSFVRSGTFVEESVNTQKAIVQEGGVLV